MAAEMSGPRSWGGNTGKHLCCEQEAPVAFMAKDWIIWQLLDSAFPAGGFAHSAGLEAAWQTGLLGGSSNLEEFIQSSLRQTARSTAVFAAATCREPGCFQWADALCDANLVNHVANRASRSQGHAVLTAAERIFSEARLEDFAATARATAAVYIMDQCSASWHHNCNSALVRHAMLCCS